MQQLHGLERVSCLLITNHSLDEDIFFHHLCVGDLDVATQLIGNHFKYDEENGQETNDEDECHDAFAPSNADNKVANVVEENGQIYRDLEIKTELTPSQRGKQQPSLSFPSYTLTRSRVLPEQALSLENETHHDHRELHHSKQESGSLFVKPKHGLVPEIVKWSLPAHTTQILQRTC